MLCSNTHYLSIYEHNQSLLEDEWELSKPQKCDDVVDYAKKIMEGNVSGQEFYWVFNDFYIDSDLDGDIYVDGFQEALDKWNLGEDFTTQDEIDMIWSIAKAAIEGASHILFDVELDELSTWSSGKDHTNLMIKQVIYD